MSWTCPYCGYRNRDDPLNSRHRPLCGGCLEEYDTPERLQKETEGKIALLKKEMAANHETQIKIRSNIEHLNTELAKEQGDLREAESDYSAMHKDLVDLEKRKVHGLEEEEDKAARARLDIHQKTLPLPEGVPA